MCPTEQAREVLGSRAPLSPQHAHAGGTAQRKVGDTMVQEHEKWMRLALDEARAALATRSEEHTSELQSHA